MLAETEDPHVAVATKEISLILDETSNYYKGSFNVTGNFLGKFIKID